MVRLHYRNFYSVTNAVKSEQVHDEHKNGHQPSQGCTSSFQPEVEQCLQPWLHYYSCHAPQDDCSTTPGKSPVQKMDYEHN